MLGLRKWVLLYASSEGGEPMTRLSDLFFSFSFLHFTLTLDKINSVRNTPCLVLVDNKEIYRWKCMPPFGLKSKTVIRKWCRPYDWSNNSSNGENLEMKKPEFKNTWRASCSSPIYNLSPSYQTSWGISPKIFLLISGLTLDLNPRLPSGTS